MGWNGSDGSKVKDQGRGQERMASGFNIKALLAGGIAVAIGLLVVLVWPSGKDARSDTESKKGKTIKEVAPAKVAKAVPETKVEPVKPVSTNSPKWEAAKGLDPALFPYKDGRKVLSTFTNNWDQIVDICIMPNGRSRKVIRNAKPPTFEHATDQLIAWALSGSNDEEVPPLPIGDNMESEFLESLKTPIVVKDDDSDAIRQEKENVIEARKFIDAELRKGKSFKSILDEHVAQRKGNAEMRQMAMDTVRRLEAEGDATAVSEYVEKVNGILRDKGIGEISEPPDNPKRRRSQAVSQ